MRLIGEAGTDGATVVLWDPEALPADFEARYRDEALDLLEALQRQGRLFWTETGGDGAFLLHVYLDVPVPESLAGHCEDPLEIARFQVPSGVLQFAGAEYVYRQDDAFLVAHAHMGSRLELPAGTYHARIYRVEYPVDYVEEQVRSRLGKDAYQYRETSGGLIAGAAILTLIGIIVLFLSRLAGWSLAVAGVAALLWVAVVVRVRSPRYHEVGERSGEIEQDYPSIVVELQTTIGASPDPT